MTEPLASSHPEQVPPCPKCGFIPGVPLVERCPGCGYDLRRCIHCDADLVWNGEWSVWKCPNQHDDPRG